MAFGSGLITGLIAGKPKMPGFDQIDPQKEQEKAIKGNVAALPEANKLASGVNQFNLEQLDQMLNFAIPGFDSIRSGVSSKIGDMVEGKLPDDVSQAVLRGSAAQALEGGYAGSGMGRNLTARDLGLTSLNLIEKGISSAENWFQTMKSVATPQLFDVGNMFITPQQQIATDVEERNAKFQHDWSKNILDWQSSPRYLAAQDMAETNSMIGSMAGSVAGGAAGGGGGL